MNKAKFFVLIWLLCFSPVLAQDYNVIDSLRHELSQVPKNEQTEILLDLAWEYRKSLPDSSLYYCSSILVNLPEVHPVYPKVLNFMGVAYHYKGDDVESFNYYSKAFEAAGKLKDSLQIAHSLNNMGRFYMIQGDHVKSYDAYMDAMEIFEALNDLDALSYGYKSLAELYVTQDNYTRALEMCRKTLELRRETGNVHGQISALIEIAEISLEQENFEETISNYEEAMLIATDIQDWAMMANIHLGLADVLCYQGSYPAAIEEVSKANTIANNLDNQTLHNRTSLLNGKLNYKLGNLALAQTYLNDLIEGLSHSKDLTLETNAHYYLARIYKETGRYEEAFEEFERHHELTAVLESAENARMIERLEARIEIEGQQRQNELLKAQQTANQAIQDRLKMQNVLLSVGILAAAIILIILIVMYRKRMEGNKKLIQKNNFIASQREEIRNQNDQIAEQNEKLRHRNDRLRALNNEKDTLMNILAHDLKAPFNRVKGLTHLLEFTTLNEEQNKYVNMLSGATDNGLNLIRDLLEVSAFSDEEKKPAMKKISLEEHFREKQENFRTEAESKHIKLKIELEQDVLIQADPSYLSRILDNLISNAIKFSDPGKDVILSGGMKGGIRFFSVKDFGPGFSETDRKNLYHKFARLSAQPTAGESSNGLGLAIVKILVDGLNGEIELISEPGNGSEFIIRFPSYTEHEERIKDKV